MKYFTQIIELPITLVFVITITTGIMIGSTSTIAENLAPAGCTPSSCPKGPLKDLNPLNILQKIPGENKGIQIAGVKGGIRNCEDEMGETVGTLTGKKKCYINENENTYFTDKYCSSEEDRLCYASNGFWMPDTDCSEQASLATGCYVENTNFWATDACSDTKRNDCYVPSSKYWNTSKCSTAGAVTGCFAEGGYWSNQTCSATVTTDCYISDSKTCTSTDNNISTKCTGTGGLWTKKLYHTDTAYEDSTGLAIKGAAGALDNFAAIDTNVTEVTSTTIRDDPNDETSDFITYNEVTGYTFSYYDGTTLSTLPLTLAAGPSSELPDSVHLKGVKVSCNYPAKFPDCDANNSYQVTDAAGNVSDGCTTTTTYPSRKRLCTSAITEDCLATETQPAYGKTCPLGEINL